MEHRQKLWKLTSTKDGHEVHIFRRKHPLLTFLYTYMVAVRSRGGKQFIYAWIETSAEKAVDNAQAWTISKLFDNHPYLLKAAEAHRLAQPP